MSKEIKKKEGIGIGINHNSFLLIILRLLLV
jgi:hypothetical protein